MSQKITGRSRGGGYDSVESWVVFRVQGLRGACLQFRRVLLFFAIIPRRSIEAYDGGTIAQLKSASQIIPSKEFGVS